MANGVSTLGQALDQMERLKKVQTQYSSLSTQLATGKKTQQFSGLGTDVLASKRARASVRSIEIYDTNIKSADTRLELMLTSLKEFRALAKNMEDLLIGFSQVSTHQEGEDIMQDDPLTPEEEFTRIGLDSAEMDTFYQTLQRLSGEVFDFMVDLVNTKNGDKYLFAGADSSTKPLDTNTGTLDAVVSNSINNWKNEGSVNNISTDQLIANLTGRDSSVNPTAITDTVIGFSSSLTAGKAGNVSVMVDDTKEIRYTSLGNSQGFRDMLVAASFFKSDNLMPITDVYETPYTYGDTPVQEGAPGATAEEQAENFFEVFNSMTRMVSDAMDALDQEIQNLEMAQVRMHQAQEDNAAQKNMFLSVIDDVENADLNQVAVELNTLQITLDASYRVTARLQELSLVNFI